MSVVVMDLGGTRLKAGIAERGRITKTTVAAVPRSGGRDALLDLLAKTGRTLLEEGGVQASGAGLCVPGLVEDGTLVALPGKLEGLEGADLATFLRESFAVDRTVVTNDAVAYAVGESSAGAGRGCRRAVIVTIGTGIGVTVVEDGMPATGGMFGAGILGGFIPISDATGGPADSTGAHGTIEALCAAERIADGSGYETVPEVFDAFARGEQKAHEAVSRYRAHLARALVALAHAHAPERLILGGGPMRAGNPITPGLADLVNDVLYGTYRVEVCTAELGDEASLLGLANLVDR